jgi:hypothetical protein
MKPGSSVRLGLLVVLLADLSCLYGYDDKPDYCEQNEQCPSGLCDKGSLRCMPVTGGTTGGRDAARAGEAGSGAMGGGEPAGGSPGGMGGTAGGQQPDTAPAPCASDNACPLEAPLCLAGRCAKCTAATDCAGRPGGRACDRTSGRCVACATEMDCNDPAKPFCMANQCVACQMAGPGACAGATPVCDPGSGRCVECTDEGMHCRNAERAFCRSNVCVGCVGAGGDACKGETPACDTASGRCVECVASSDCALAEPVCNTQAKSCGPCTSDGQCTGKPGGPAVCMFHQNGRCATDAETLYVSSQSGCGVGSGAGTAAMPLCTPAAAIAGLTGTRRLLVIRGPMAVPGFSWTTGGAQVSVIGQDAATITGRNAVGITVAAGDLYVRNLSVAGGQQIGIVARGRATLRLEDVRVKDNHNDQAPVSGGILIDGAAFEIKNCLISGNGPGVDGGFTWGGILVKAVSGALRRLDRVSVVDNLAPGVVCASAVTGTGTLVRNNPVLNVTPSCGNASMLMLCSTPSATCGSDLPP